MINLDMHLAMNACIYAWALVPSYYLYSFMDTNKNYLQSQGVIFPPIIIHCAAVIIHLVVCVLLLYYYGGISFLEVAWAKNITDSLCCLGLYGYIVMK